MRSTPDGDITVVKMDSAPGASKEVALFLPKGFDPSKPAIIMPYFHGHSGEGVTSGINDTLTRQRLAEQAARSGKNIAFVIPQLGPKSEFNPEFKKPENVDKFLNDSGAALANLYTSTHAGADPAQVAKSFSEMPVVPISYSGGYRATWGTLTNPRVKGAVLLDTMYSSSQPFIDFTRREDRPFVSVTYGGSTEKNSQDFAANAAKNTKVVTPMKGSHGELVQTALQGRLEAINIPENGKVTMTGVTEKVTVAFNRPQAPKT